MSTIYGERIRILMSERKMSSNELLARLHTTEGNERFARPNLSKIINNSYPGEPAAQIVRGLALVLGTSTDYLLGLSDERYPTELSFARKYELVAEDRLLAWLAQQNAELAGIMRALRNLPADEQQVILEHMANEIRFIRRMVAGKDDAVTLEPFAEGDEPGDEDEPEPAEPPQRGRRP